MSFMSWLSKIMTPSRPAPFSVEEVKMLGEPLTLLASRRTLSTPYGSVMAPWEIKVRDRTKIAIRPSDFTTAPLQQVALLHAAFEEEIEIVLLGVETPVMDLLEPYLKPSPVTRVELLNWLLTLNSEEDPLLKASEKIFGPFSSGDLSFLQFLADLLRSELRSRKPSARWSRSALAIRRELVLKWAQLWVQDLGGLIQTEPLRWTLEKEDRSFSIDLLQWMDLWVEQEPVFEFPRVLEQLKKHIEDPQSLLDPVTFTASSWQPADRHRIPDSLQIPMATFAEIRAELTLNHLQAIDGGDMIVECPDCGHILSFLSAYLTVRPLVMRSAILALYDQVYNFEQPCPHCSRVLTPQNFQAGRYFHWLLDQEADLALQLLKHPAGPITSSLRIFARDGSVFEGAPATEAVMQKQIQRNLDPKASWLAAFVLALQSKETITTPMDETSTIVTSALDLASFKEALRKAATLQDDPVKINLSSAQPDSLHHYKDWAGPYAPLLKEQVLHGGITIDKTRLKTSLKAHLTRFGVSIAAAEGKLWANLSPYRLEIELDKTLHESALSGRHIQEDMLFKAQELVSSLHKMDSFARRIKQVGGPNRFYNFDALTGSLTVSLDENKPTAVFHLPTLITAIPEDELERLARVIVTPDAQESLDFCHCGALAHVGLKMKPQEWLTTEAMAADVALEHHNDVLFVYSLDCEEHFSYIHKSTLRRVGSSLQELRDKATQDVDQIGYEVGFVTIENAIGLWGFDAASIACQPALVKKALEMADLEIGPEVQIFSQSVHTLVVADLELSQETVRLFSNKLLAILSQVMGPNPHPLALNERMLLPDTGKGQLKGLLRQSRP